MSSYFAATAHWYADISNILRVFYAKVLHTFFEFINPFWLKRITFSPLISWYSSWFQLICHSSVFFTVIQTFFWSFRNLQFGFVQMMVLCRASLHCVLNNFDLNSSIRAVYDQLAACILCSLLTLVELSLLTWKPKKDSGW